MQLDGHLNVNCGRKSCSRLRVDELVTMIPAIVFNLYLAHYGSWRWSSLSQSAQLGLVCKLRSYCLKVSFVYSYSYGDKLHIKDTIDHESNYRQRMNTGLRRLKMQGTWATIIWHTRTAPRLPEAKLCLVGKWRKRHSWQPKQSRGRFQLWSEAPGDVYSYAARQWSRDAKRDLLLLHTGHRPRDHT